jgi:hypothetical protein
VQTVQNVRKRLVVDGFELALEGIQRQTPPTPPRLDGAAEAKVIALRLGAPPAGCARWTLRLLAEHVVELEILDSISHETVRQVLKKWLDAAQGSILGHMSQIKWPPEADAEFAAHLENVLEVYAQPYDPGIPSSAWTSNPCSGSGNCGPVSTWF